MTKPTDITYLVPDQRKYRVYKHSDGTKDFQFDWQEYLEETESIASQTVTANNITLNSNSYSGQVTTVFVSGGEPQTNAYLDIAITTDNATARTFKVRVYFYFEHPTQHYDLGYYY